MQVKSMGLIEPKVFCIFLLRESMGAIILIATMERMKANKQCRLGKSRAKVPVVFNIDPELDKRVQQLARRCETSKATIFRRAVKVGTEVLEAEPARLMEAL